MLTCVILIQDACVHLQGQAAQPRLRPSTLPCYAALLFCVLNSGSLQLPLMRKLSGCFGKAWWVRAA